MFSLTDIKDAYLKLKTHIYYDNSDILLRRKLVEFETNTSKNEFLSLSDGIPQPYKKKILQARSNVIITVEKKLELIAEALNKYHSDPSFFNYFLDNIKVDFYPKELRQNNIRGNFITNKRIEDVYPVTRATAFFDGSIELHLVSLLWIIHYGKEYDKNLSEACYGNRLMLNKNKDQIIKGSSLFKPYHHQYKKWRDDSIFIADSNLKNNKSVLFLNLDIRDYFHSVRIPAKVLHEERKSKRNATQYLDNLKNIFLKIHLIYTKKVGQQYHIPYNFYSTLREVDGNLQEVILPIGLLSSYILANDYLKDFDQRVTQKIKPAYYGRYVDDIIIVIADPQIDYHDEETNEEIKFSFKDYKSSINSNGTKNQNEKVTFEKTGMSELEKYVLENFHPVIKLIDLPNFIQDEDEIEKCKIKDGISKIFKLRGYQSLYCQTNKSLAYLFDHNESDLVIDKLKKELDERTSEFRDFPEEDNIEESFEESAYHLNYDGTSGKIRTLKDYKEDRYGLTVYLSNKIFSALRHEKTISKEETLEVLKFFQGSTCLTFHRLWERIFTFFLVNKQADAYVKFYIHCLHQIDKIQAQINFSLVKSENLKVTLIEFLDAAHEISLSLNPQFFKKAQDAARNFEIELNVIKKRLPTAFLLSFVPTKPDSLWIVRFSQTNMMRHHYVVHPLLNFTKRSQKGRLDLTSLELNFKDYILDENLLKSSPRPVKFWECSMAIIFKEIFGFKRTTKEHITDSVLSQVLGLKELPIDADTEIEEEAEKVFYLDKGFELYKIINENHISQHQLNSEEFRNNHYQSYSKTLKFDNISSIDLQQIRVNSRSTLNEPKIAFANTEVDEDSILLSLRGTPNLSSDRYAKLAEILKRARKEHADMLLFPEFFIPLNLLSSVIRYSERNQVLTVTGLEHFTIDNTAFNFIVTILPFKSNEIRDAVPVFRLKNHYAHIEDSLVVGNHYTVPKPNPHRYDIFIWRNIYFSTFYCFELANSFHRSLFKGKIDLLIGIEWNRDTPYFSNIVEAGSRDLHCYVAQVNTSHYGDTRLTQPVESARKDILRLKGGKNDAILVESISVSKLREFQRKKFALTHHEKLYKPLPPDFLLTDVLNRINNRDIL